MSAFGGKADIVPAQICGLEPSTDQAMTIKAYFLLEMIYRRRSAEDIRGASIA
jgi:hypothetical protein